MCHLCCTANTIYTAAADHEQRETCAVDHMHQACSAEGSPAHAVKHPSPTRSHRTGRACMFKLPECRIVAQVVRPLRRHNAQSQKIAQLRPETEHGQRCMHEQPHCTETTLVCGQGARARKGLSVYAPSLKWNLLPHMALVAQSRCSFPLPSPHKSMTSAWHSHTTCHTPRYTPGGGSINQTSRRIGTCVSLTYLSTVMSATRPGRALWQHQDGSEHAGHS